MKIKIYVCGNPIVDEDRMPFKILPDLRRFLPEVEFADFDPTENFPDDDPLYIIDTVANSDNIVLLEDVGALQRAPHVSVHDADLAFHLKLMAKAGRLPEIKIFAVPARGSVKELARELADLIKKVIPI